MLFLLPWTLCFRCCFSRCRLLCRFYCGLLAFTTSMMVLSLVLLLVFVFRCFNFVDLFAAVVPCCYCSVAAGIASVVFSFLPFRCSFRCGRFFLRLTFRSCSYFCCCCACNIDSLPSFQLVHYYNCLITELSATLL